MSFRFVFGCSAAVLVCVAAGRADVVDLVNGTSGSANGAFFARSSVQSAGTGVLDSFVRVQHDNGPSNNGHSPTGEEQGYNTSGRPVQYDELTDPNFTRNLLYGDIPTVLVNGVACKEFLLDINESSGGTHRFLSLDQINIYTSATGSQTGLESTLGVLRYSLGPSLDANVVTLDYSLNHGSGQADMVMDVPVSNFAGVGNDSFVYLYSYFGHYGADYQSDAGFEEWAVGPVPGPGTSALFIAAGLAACRRRRG